MGRFEIMLWVKNENEGLEIYEVIKTESEEKAIILAQVFINSKFFARVRIKKIMTTETSYIIDEIRTK